MSSGYEAQMAAMFGYKQQKEQQKWEKRRAARAEKVGFFKGLSKGLTETGMEFSSRNIDARLRAAHQQETQTKFDTEHVKTTTRRNDGQTISESVTYEPRMPGSKVEDELEF